MTVYVDRLQEWGHGLKGKWCHMMTDGDIDELHKFAEQVGLKRSWFQGKHDAHPHYDLSPSLRQKAVGHGAVEVDQLEMLRRCRRYLGKARSQLARYTAEDLGLVVRSHNWPKYAYALCRGCGRRKRVGWQSAGFWLLNCSCGHLAAIDPAV